MASTTTRTLHDRMGGVRRFARALANDPSEWDPSDLVDLEAIIQSLQLVRARAVYGMRESGSTDREIAEALGVTRQAVSKRWPGGGRYVGAAGRYRSTTNQSGG